MKNKLGDLNGPVPDGHALKCLDGDRANTSPSNWVARILDAIALAAMVAAGMAALGATARAHQAPTGWTYDGACCNAAQVRPDGSVTGDCAPIPAGTVTITREGYRVALEPGDHPRVTRPRSYLFGHSERGLRPSGDEHYHLCAIEGVRFCLYAPPGGV